MKYIISKIFDECKSYGRSGSGLNGLMAITGADRSQIYNQQKLK